MVSPGQLPERLEDPFGLEREWWWVNGALHAVAQLQAEGPRTIRDLDAQARNVDRMRVAIAARLAQLACPAAPRPPIMNAPRQSL